jgi:hypothetical protein
MENQMIRLQQTVADDVKRRESESKRDNNLERGFSNQVSRISIKRVTLCGEKKESGGSRSNDSLLAPESLCR